VLRARHGWTRAILDRAWHSRPDAAHAGVDGALYLTKGLENTTDAIEFLPVTGIRAGSAMIGHVSSIRRRLLRPVLWLVVVAPLFTAGDAAVASIAFEESLLTIAAADDRFEFRVEMAVSPAQRSQGLMFRESLEEDRGMLFDFGKPQQATMWMRNTYVPLDMLFLDEHGRITQIAADAQPLSDAVIASRDQVRAVLELGGGVSAKLGIKPGDRVIHPLFTEP
jgi:uncharacterized membrane protein (UPF0127 family)